MKKIKKVIFDLLDREEINGPIERIINLLIICLIILNVFAMMIEPSVSSVKFKMV